MHSAGFMTGLASSWIVVPVISVAAIDQMRGLDEEREMPDNVLLEWLGALELQARGHVKAIMPLICAPPGGGCFDFSLPEKLPKFAHDATNMAAIKHLRQHTTSKGIEDDEMLSGASRIIMEVMSTASVDMEQAVPCSPSAILTAILRFQGVQIEERNDEKSLHTELNGLQLGQLKRKAMQQGINTERLQIAIDSADEPIDAAIEMIASEAPPVPETVMRECAARIVDAMSGVYQQAPIA